MQVNTLAQKFCQICILYDFLLN